MIVSLGLMFVALRAGLAIRRRRARGLRPELALRKRHLAFAKPAVVVICIGFVAGPVSAVYLRDWDSFGTFHALLGILATACFVAAAILGHKLEKGKGSREIHAWTGLSGFLAAAVAAMAGFVLLP